MVSREICSSSARARIKTWSSRKSQNEPSTRGAAAWPFGAVAAMSPPFILQRGEFVPEPRHLRVDLFSQPRQLHFARLQLFFSCRERGSFALGNCCEPLI